MPRSGGLSAGDDVTLVVSKARYGLLPNFAGSSLEAVGRELERLKLRWRVVTVPGHRGNVLRQRPSAGVASAPGLMVTLVVGDG
jgi:beta-lactam-binding protein with PASTA domain